MTLVLEKLKNVTFTKIIDIKTVPSAKFRYEKIINRSCYGLSFCITGQIDYVHNGKTFVSDNRHAIILPKGASYILKGKENGLFPIINFDCKDTLCDTFVPIPLSDNDYYIKCFKQMLSLQLFSDNHTRIMSILYNMVYHLTSVSNPNNTILPAIKFIENNYRNPDLSNVLLARECNISEVYLRRLFLKQFNTTPKQFIIDIRIQKAKQLLAEGVMKINIISEICGFSNPYHFCRVFKEKTGITPSEYMKQNKTYEI